MAYTLKQLKVELRAEVRDEVNDVLNNGFKDELVQVLVDKVFPEINRQVIGLYEQWRNAQDGVCQNRLTVCQRSFEGLRNADSNLETLIPRFNDLSKNVEKLEQSREKDSLSLARIEVGLSNLDKRFDSVSETQKEHDDRIAILEKTPGASALAHDEKTKRTWIGAAIGVVFTIAAAILLALFNRFILRG